MQLVEVVEKLAEASMRYASGLGVDYSSMPPSLRGAAEKIVPSLASRLVSGRSALRCRLCGKGPFTQRGLYLHLRRVHYEKVLEMAREELEAYLWRQ